MQTRDPYFKITIFKIDSSYTTTTEHNTLQNKKLQYCRLFMLLELFRFSNATLCS